MADSLIPQQSPTQAQNALNPTPAQLQMPGGLFFDANDAYKTALYYRNADNTYSAFGIPDIAKQYYGQAAFDQANGLGGAYNYSGGSTQMGLNALKALGIDVSKIGSQSFADRGTLQTQGKISQGTVDMLKSILQSAQTTAPTNYQTINNTPNTIDQNAIQKSQAAAQQQLAGVQGMNVQTTTNQQGQITGTNAVPLSSNPAQSGQQAFQQAQSGQLGTPQNQTNPNAIPMSGGYVPTAAPNPLETMKQQLLNASPWLTSQGAPPQTTSDKYQQAFDQLKNQQAPTSQGQASNTLQQFMGTQASNLTPTQSFLQNYTSMNPVERGFFDMVNKILSPQSTQTTLVQEYQNLVASSALQGLQTELMNINNIMSGTEDDIRTEVQKAGGFATDSQVQALTVARNKTLMKQAASLQAQIDQKEHYIDQIVQLSGADRAQVQKDIDRKLGLAETFTNLQMQMDNAARSNYQSIIKDVGYDGLAKLLNHNPQAMAAAESALGLPPGAFANEAFMALASKNDAKLQFVSGTPNQRSGYFNPSTGAFTPYGGGGGSASAGGTIPTNPYLTQAIQTIRQSLSNPTKAQLAEIDSIANSQNPLAAIQNQAKNVMGQTLATNLSNQERAQTALSSIDDALSRFYANGGDTNIFTGSYEQAIAKLGNVSNPELRKIATEIESALQIYRNAVSGTAYSVQEGKAIADIFPGINKTSGLNRAIIDGRQAVFSNTIDSAYEQVLGRDTYQAIKKQYAPSTGGSVSTASKMPPGTIVSKNGIQYMVGPDGESLTQVTGAINYGALNTNGSFDFSKYF